jgi:hypothetical protein
MPANSPDERPARNLSHVCGRRTFYTAIRTAGDLLISYDLASGGTVPVISYRKWLESGGGQTASVLCEASASFPCWGKAQAIDNSQNATVKAAVNTTQVADGANTLSAFMFGEALINLEGSGILPLPSSSSQCVAFGMAYLKSRSSSSFTAEIKDFIAPMLVDISNCPDKVVKNSVSSINGTLVSPDGNNTGTITITLVPQQ